MTVEHPEWCCRANCTVNESGRGCHSSRVVELRCGPPSDLELKVKLVQFRSTNDQGATGVTMVDLESYVPNYGPESPEVEDGFVIEPRYALALGHALISMGRAAQRDTSP
ncbi:MAG: hypothetical protein AUG44_00730 [Actinobacteria bacterium 13_1_20CM_3_71_11]|nr:MAG: hypothetical protein AUG44_00730 [Actinobacteria bacterium 13_1_20CM_3_71_11]